jgi:hypothetical protein
MDLTAQTQQTDQNLVKDNAIQWYIMHVTGLLLD